MQTTDAGTPYIALMLQSTIVESLFKMLVNGVSRGVAIIGSVMADCPATLASPVHASYVMPLGVPWLMLYWYALGLLTCGSLGCRGVGCSPCHQNRRL